MCWDQTNRRITLVSRGLRRLSVRGGRQYADRTIPSLFNLPQPVEAAEVLARTITGSAAAVEAMAEVTEVMEAVITSRRG